jgi:hypothetical protein
LPGPLIFSAASSSGNAGAKIHSSAQPLSEVTRLFAIRARRDFQHLIGNFVDEKFFFVLFDSHFIHGGTLLYQQHH